MMCYYTLVFHIFAMIYNALPATIYYILHSLYDYQRPEIKIVLSICAWGEENLKRDITTRIFILFVEITAFCLHML